VKFTVERFAMKAKKNIVVVDSQIAVAMYNGIHYNLP
jgi:hypothetical protein